MRVVVAAIVVLAASACTAEHVRPKVSRITISPTPEGPTLVASADTAHGRELLSAVAGSIPDTLPANPSQQCRLGSTIDILVWKQTYRYGPCTWPQAIERLRRALIAAAERHGPSAPPRPVSAAAWKAVFADWYDGHMDHWHSCAAVLEALRHVPVDGPIYSTLGLDLHAYARGVC